MEEGLRLNLTPLLHKPPAYRNLKVILMTFPAHTHYPGFGLSQGFDSLKFITKLKKAYQEKLDIPKE